MKSERDLFIASIFIFLTVVSWITFELLKTTKTSTTPTTTQQLIVPLTPNVDVDTLKLLEAKKAY